MLGAPGAYAEGAAPSCITTRSGRVPTRRSRQARCCAERLAAGIDAASMARRCHNLLKGRTVFFSPRQGVACGEVDGGLMRRLTGSSRGILARGLGAGRDTQARPGAHFTESPLGTRPSRPGSDAREPKQQAPVHLGARVPSARAKRTTSPSAKRQAPSAMLPRNSAKNRIPSNNLFNELRTHDTSAARASRRRGRRGGSVTIRP